MPNKTRYAVVGTGARCVMFIDPIVDRFAETNELVAFCDLSQGKMDFHNNRLGEKFSHPPVPTYSTDDFERMVRETKPDVVIVTTVDGFHHEYIVRAMDMGCDAIVEKPITTDDAKMRAIYDAVERTGRKLRVTFNLRWAPGATTVWKTLREGAIGEVIHVDLQWRLNTSHGADYFRRWHREKDKSGGLLVHKSTHHFDMVNWLIDAAPERVFALGRLAFYGRENAEKRGLKVAYDRYTGHDTSDDPFALKIDDGMLRDLYYNTEKESGYVRDRNVFGDNITIEDTMSVLVKYRTGVSLNYSLNAYLPSEGFTLAINGTKGRLEYREDHGTHIFGASGDAPAIDRQHSLVVHPMFGAPYEVEIPEAKGGHGGADPLLAEQIFAPNPPEETCARNAAHGQGAASALIGIAANHSIASGEPVRIADLCPQLGDAVRLSDLP